MLYELIIVYVGINCLRICNMFCVCVEEIIYLVIIIVSELLKKKVLFSFVCRFDDEVFVCKNSWDE